MSMIKEFRKFAVRGNAVDMAVGIIVSAAFGNLEIVLKEAAADSPEVVLRYGQFINTLVNFLIVSFSVFIVIKGLNSLKKKPG